MRKFFLKVTGKPSVEEKKEGELEEVEGGSNSGGARRRWRLAKNMLVAFKVASKVFSVRMMVMTCSQVEREEEEKESRRRRDLQRRSACGRRISFLGQQYPNMVGSQFNSQSCKIGVMIKLCMNIARP